MDFFSIKRFYLIFFFFTIITTIQAQFSDIKFDRIGVEDGLSQSSVTAIVQDSIGFIWFATYEGLNRFDGYEFKIYKAEDQPTNGLSDNFIKSLFIDSKGALWVGTANGLNIYDQEKDKFISFKNDKNNNRSISENNITTIFEDKNNVIWIGTFEKGLNRFNNKDSSFTRFLKNDNDTNSISDNSIESLLEDSNGNFWVGTVGGGLNRLDRQSNKFIQFSHQFNNTNSISRSGILDVIEDKNGNLIIASWQNGLNFFDFQKETLVNKFFDSGIYAILLYKNRYVLAGTRNKGLMVYDILEDKTDFYTKINGDVNSISSNSVYSIFIDNAGTIWLGTSGGGINKFNPNFKNFKVFQNNPIDKNSLSNNYILSIIEDRNNNLWIGTRGGGLNFYDTKNNKWALYKNDPKNINSISDDIISSLYEDSKGNIWIGTETGGLNRYLPKQNGFKSYTFDSNNNNSISSNWVTDLYQDRDGIFWLSTFSGGLNRFDPINESFTPYFPDDSSSQSKSINSLLKLYEDNENNIWAGSFGFGLIKFNKKEGSYTSYRNNSDDSTSISSDLVLCVHPAKPGELWAGTILGLNRLNADGTFSKFTVYDGLPDNGVYGILEDDSGFLWLSTNKGLARFNPVDNSVKVYNKGDGLPDDELNFGPAFKSNNGTMYFGGPNGFFYFHPDSLKTNSFLPPVVFTDFSVLNKPASIGENIATAQHINLNYNDNIFTFTFTALNYIQSSENKFAYKLEGFRDDWIYLDDERKITFTNLDPGDYILRVKASNNDGLWNEKGRALAITIVPPYWGTWWFRAIFIVLLLTLGPIFYYRRVTALKKEQKLQQEFSIKLINSQEQERSRIAQELHDSLGQELLLIKNRAALGLKNISNEIKTKQQLEYISEYSSNAINRVREISHNLRPPELDRLGLTETLVTMVNEINETKVIKINSKIENIDDRIEKDKEINLLRIVQESIANAIKHSGAAEIIIKVEIQNGIIKVVIEDNGKGFDTELYPEVKTMGLGFRGMKERAIILEGSFTVESLLGKGTKIKIGIPIKNES